MRQLTEENARLKRIVAHLTLDKQILQEVIKKSSEASSAQGAGAMDPRALHDQQAPQLRAGSGSAGHLVLPQPGTRPVSLAHGNQGNRDEPPALSGRSHGLEHSQGANVQAEGSIHLVSEFLLESFQMLFHWLKKLINIK